MANDEKIYKFKPFETTGKVLPDGIDLRTDGGFLELPQLLFNNSNIFFVNKKEVWAYRLPSKKFIKLFTIKAIDLFGPLELCCSVLHNNRIYIILGSREALTFNFFISYDLKSEEKIPGSHDLFYYNNYLYAVIKNYRHNSIALCRLNRSLENPKDFKWENLKTFTEAFEDGTNLRKKFKTYQYGNKIFVFTTEKLNRIGIIDLDNHSWDLVATNPEVNQEIISSLGRCNGDVLEYVEENSGVKFLLIYYQTTMIFYQEWTINLKTLKMKHFSFLEKSVIKKIFSTICMMTSNYEKLYYYRFILTSNGRFVVYEKKDPCTNEYIPKIHSCWIKIPSKLEEICWEAVTHYYPEVETSSEEQLIEIYGIPPKIALEYNI